MIKQLPSDNDKKMKDKVHVFYIDFGDEEWLPLSRVYPLPEPFIYLPPLVLKCSLAFVKPVGLESGNDWPEKATETFVSLATFEKRLLMHVVHGSLSADRKGFVTFSPWRVNHDCSRQQILRFLSSFFMENYFPRKMRKDITKLYYI